MMDLDGLELRQDGNPFPTITLSLHYDFISRCDGDECRNNRRRDECISKILGQLYRRFR
ncbi:MAG: hypothetical protein ACLRJV_23590 [Eubacteriales bacterium]